MESGKGQSVELQEGGESGREGVRGEGGRRRRVGRVRGGGGRGEEEGWKKGMRGDQGHEG